MKLYYVIYRLSDNRTITHEVFDTDYDACEFCQLMIDSGLPAVVRIKTV